MNWRRFSRRSQHSRVSLRTMNGGRMAKATVVRAEAPVEKVTLELSHEEAQALANLLGAITPACERHVGNQGDVDTSLIYDKLAEVGYESVDIWAALRPGA